MYKSLALSVAAVVAISAATAPATAAVFSSGAYNSTLALDGSGLDTQIGVAFSKGSYYLVSGGGPQSPISRTTIAGKLIESPISPNPGIDFRSIFTDARGAIFARGYASNVIYKQDGALGNFKPIVTLDGSSENQQQIVLSSDGTSYIGNNDGTLQFWNLAGQLTRTVTLDASANGVQFNHEVSILGNYAVDYNNGTLSAFSLANGSLVGTTVLNGDVVDGTYGQSYANGYFFVSNGSQFLGYKIGASSAVPEPSVLLLMPIGFGMLALGRRRSVRNVVTA